MTTTTTIAADSTAVESAPERIRRSPGWTRTRKLAFVAGALYLATFLTSIPALLLKAPAMDDPAGFVLGAGSAGAVTWASYLDAILALCGIGAAVALYPITRRISQTAGLGFVTSRVIEGALILVGVISLMAMVTLRSDATGGDAGGLASAGSALLAVHDWTFLFGPGVMSAVNALCLATVVLRGRLVPRDIPLMGLVGAPLLLLSATATVFGIWDQTSPVAMLLVLPVATWELSLGVYLAVKGFRPSPYVSEDAAVDEPRVVRAG